MTTPANFPPTMPDPSGDPHGARAQAARLLDDAGSATVPLTGQLVNGEHLAVDARRAAGLALDGIAAVRQHVHRTLDTVDKHAADDTLPEPARRRLTDEAHTTARKDIADARKRADAALSVLETALTDAAQPTFPEGADREEARQEMRLLLDGADDPAATVRDLAAGPDPRLAALAAGTFAGSYLRSRGVPDAVISATRQTVAADAVTSSDPKRRAAGAGLTKMGELRRLRDQVHAAASFVLP